MKKTLFIIFLTAVISTGMFVENAFADHPDGLGISIKGSWGSTWVYRTTQSGPSLSIKTKASPVFWGIRLDINEDKPGLFLSGDYYLNHNPLVQDINLYWYYGVGAEFGIGMGENNFSLGAGVRVPVGISFQIEFTSFPTLEFFMQLVPRMGIQFVPFHFPYGLWGFDLGARIWLDV